MGASVKELKTKLLFREERGGSCGSNFEVGTGKLKKEETEVEGRFKIEEDYVTYKEGPIGEGRSVEEQSVVMKEC